MPTKAPASPDGKNAGGKTGTDRPRSLPHEAVSQVIGRLQPGYRNDHPWAVAAVARLRREAGRDAHVSPTAWGLDHLETLAELREERRAEERERNNGGHPAPAYFSSAAYLWSEAGERREDTAVHIAVTLWALHQQSVRDDAMHVAGWPLGRAVRRLSHGKTGTRDGGTAAGDTRTGERPAAAERVEDAGENVRRRFVRIGTASDTDVIAVRLREMVLLLRSARIPLDYALLADQLLLWQDDNRRDDVRRTWGRDFHRHYGRFQPDGTGGGDDEDGADAVPEEDLDAADAGT